MYRLSIKLLTIKMTTFGVLCLAFARKLPLTALDNWGIRSLKFLEFESFDVTVVTYNDK